MEEHILNLLKTSNKVIIPEFGAFIVKQNNPRVIIFNEFLQYNDGMLQAEIKKQEKADDEAVKNKINRFIDDIKSKLDKDGEVQMKGLGVLSKSSSGKITLKESGKKEGQKTKEPEKKTQKETAKKVPASKTPVAGKKEEKTSEPIELSTDKNEPLKKEKPAAKTEEIKKEEPKKEEPKKPEPAENTSKKDESPTYKYTSSSYSSQIEKKEEKQDGKPVFVSKKKKKKTGATIFWILFLLIINGAILVILFVPEVKDKFMGFFNKESEETEYNIEKSEEETGITDEEIVDRIESELIEQEEEKSLLEKEQKKIKSVGSAIPQTQTVQKPPVSKGERWYIVVGVFNNEEYADNLVRDLAGKGYDAEKFGRIGRMHAVSCASFNDEYSARQELNRFKNEVNRDVWVLKY